MYKTLKDVSAVEWINGIDFLWKYIVGILVIACSIKYLVT